VSPRAEAKTSSLNPVDQHDCSCRAEESRLGSSAMLKFELERGLGVRSINLLKIAAEAETLRLRALLARQARRCLRCQCRCFHAHRLRIRIRRDCGLADIAPLCCSHPGDTHSPWHQSRNRCRSGGGCSPVIAKPDRARGAKGPPGGARGGEGRALNHGRFSIAEACGASKAPRILRLRAVTGLACTWRFP
jgi:hypothetical protein